MNVVNCFFVVFVSVMMCGCGSWPSKPSICFRDQIAVSPLSKGELKAVKFVKKHFGASCRPSSVECNLKLVRKVNGEIEVVASKALLVGDPPSCTRLEGSFDTYVFSAEGEYIRVVLGL
jgi:hypothetical protein